MQGISTLGLVVLGNSLPVATVDLEDFQTILGPLALEVRAPMVIQAQSETGSFTIMENRFALERGDPIPEDARQRMADAVRLYATEYAGKRGPTALGQNFQGVIATAGPGRDFLNGFLDRPRVDRVLKSEAPPGTSLTLFFKRGRESRAQVVLKAPEDDPTNVTYAFNFHFDLKRPEGPTLLEAMDDWEKSERFAEESIEALVALADEGAK